MTEFCEWTRDKLLAEVADVAVVVCVIIYNAAFGMSWGPVPW